MHTCFARFSAEVCSIALKISDESRHKSVMRLRQALPLASVQIKAALELETIASQT
jgi:hypothetical protein